MSHPRRFLMVTMIGLTAAGLLPIPAGRAADTAKPASSLQWVPDDAAFFGAMLRGREQIQAVARSRAWAKLKSLPFVQGLRQKIEEQLNDEEGKLAPLVKWYQAPENRELVALLGDMFSTEVFLYGGDSWVGFTKLAQEMIGAVRFGPVLLQLKGEGRGMNQNELRARILLQVLSENLDSIKVPDVVIGFKLTKTERAEAQLKRLEGLLEKAARKNPRFKKLIGHEKVGDSTFLTLTADGSMVPWDRIPFKDLEEKEGQYDPLIKKLKTLKLTVALGIRDDYLLLSLGESLAPVKRLGQGQALAARNELKPLAKFADKRLTSINYVSKAFMTQVATNPSDIDGMLEMARRFLPDSLTDQQKAQIRKDLADLGKDIKTFLPQPGPVLSFSFLTGHGYESYTYDWGKYARRDGSKPLTLLRHAGGNPLLVTVERSKVSGQQYRMMVKWIKVGYRYFEEYGVPHLGEGVQEKYQEAAKAFKPLLKRLDQVTSKMLLPALQDGQMGLVLDAKIKSKQWCKAMPESAQPLPMLEPALIAGVSDADLLRKAFGEYRNVINDILAKIHDLAPDKVPELKIPRPRSAQVDGGTVYFYPLPEKWGLDSRLLPNGALGEHVAALTIAKEHSQRLLADNPLKFKHGPLADPDRPLAGATHIDCEGLLDAVAPWVDYAVRQIAPRVMGLDVDDPADRANAEQQLQPILKQVHTVIEVLKVFRSYSSATYLEEGAWVTHAQTVIRDLPEDK
jgi:hypothetical protein